MRLFAIISPQGETVLKKNIGTEEDDKGFAITQTSDGGYAIAGYTHKDSPSGKKRAWIVKTDSQGNVKWDQKLTPSGSDGQFLDIIRGPDNELVAIGEKDQKLLLVSIAADGQLRWETDLNQPENTIGTSVSSTFDGDYFVTGYASDRSRSELIAARLDKEGKPLWTISEKDFTGKAGIPTQNGGFSVVGTTSSNRGDISLLHLDQNGQKQWQQIYPGTGKDQAQDLIQSFNGTYYITGSSFSYLRGARRSKLWLLPINQDGEEIVKDRIYFGGNQDDQGSKLLQLFDGSILAAGFTESNKAQQKAGWVLNLE